MQPLPGSNRPRSSFTAYQTRSFKHNRCFVHFLYLAVGLNFNTFVAVFKNQFKNQNVYIFFHITIDQRVSFI